jgi:hypothetical protein
MGIRGKKGLLSIVAPLAAAGLAIVELSSAGCGTQPTGDTLEVEAEASALQNNDGYTTRDICKACGCVASDVACNCGTPPSKKKLACINNGGPGKLSAGAAAAVGGITYSTSTTLQ